MILVTKLPTGLLIQRDGAELIIADSAVSTALGPIIHELIDSGREEGLIVGHQNGARETEARFRREAEQFAEGLALLKVSAPLAA